MEGVKVVSWALSRCRFWRGTGHNIPVYLRILHIHEVEHLRHSHPLSSFWVLHSHTERGSRRHGYADPRFVDRSCLSGKQENIVRHLIEAYYDPHALSHLSKAVA